MDHIFESWASVERNIDAKLLHGFVHCAAFPVELGQDKIREILYDELLFNVAEDREGGLFHGDAFGEIAGLIHVAAAQDGAVVGEKLQRHHREERHEDAVI